MLKTPPVFRDRIKILQQRLGPLGIDALLITNPVDIRYLTGFIGDDSWAVLPMRGLAAVVLSDNRFEEQVAREAPHISAVMRKKSLADELAKLTSRRGYGVVGVPEAYVTLAGRKVLMKALGGAKRLKAVDDGLLMQRAVKTPDEVKLIAKAGRIQQQAFRELLDFMKPGMREEEACAFLEYRMRCLGADGVSFPSIVAADANAALPHAIPGKTRLKQGGIVLIDWGAKFGGYCSDMTRVVAFGGMKPRLREVYSLVLAAQEAAIDAIRPGADLTEIDEVARGIIRKAGYGKQFGHGLGHGVGLDIHEQPVLSYRAKGKLEPGHVVTVEPGIYLPGVGGVRIEDDVLVTERGHRILTDLPKTLESAIIA